jgi:hypothetical protein
MFQLQLFFCSIVTNGTAWYFLLQADVNIPIVTSRPFSLPCYLQGSENGRVVTIGKHSRLNRVFMFQLQLFFCSIVTNGTAL